MKIKLLKNIIGHVAGKGAVNIVDLLADKKNVNEFLIAKKLALTINQTRNILYKLSDEQLVSFTRKKDKRKGWYTYFWTLNTSKTLEFLKEMLDKEIKELKNQLSERKTKRFYYCETCNLEVNEESALMSDFSCKECGEIYSLSESERFIKELEKNIKQLENDLDFVHSELEKEEEKRKKKVKRQIKKEAKDKAEQRAIRKSQREKLKEKTGRKKDRKKKSKEKTNKKQKNKKSKKKTAKKKTKKKKLLKKKTKKKSKSINKRKK